MKKKKIILTFWLVLSLLSFNVKNAKADEIVADNISPGTYVIGNYLYDRNKGNEYDSVLTVKHIMLAAKSLSSNTVSDMKIYYKNSRGKWVDPITNEPIDVEKNFTILYVNNNKVNVIYGDINNDGVVDTLDRIVLARSIDGEYEIDEYVKTVGDLDQNGIVNMVDYDILTKHLAKWKNYEKIPLDLEKVLIYGDANEDGVVNADDLSAMLEAANGNRMLSKIANMQMDLNKDDTVNITDVIILQKYLLGFSGYEQLPVMNTEENVIYGDINRDGVVDTLDRILFSRTVYLNYEIDEYIKVVGDLDLNGKIDAVDVDILTRYLAKWKEYDKIPVDISKVWQYGDLNNDNVIDYIDLQILGRVVFGNEAIDGISKLAADTKLDGKLDRQDVIVLHNYLAGFSRKTYNKLGNEYKTTTITGALYKGDVDANGEVNELDVKEIENYLAGKKLLSGVFLMEADINLDGVINKTDALILALHINKEPGFENLYAIDLDKVIKYGDLNNDKEVNEEDLTIMRQYLTNSRELNNLEFLKVDVNKDGKFNSLDLAITEAHINGKISKLPYDALND